MALNDDDSQREGFEKKDFSETGQVYGHCVTSKKFCFLRNASLLCVYAYSSFYRYYIKAID